MCEHKIVLLFKTVYVEPQRAHWWQSRKGWHKPFGFCLECESEFDIQWQALQEQQKYAK